MLSFFLNLVVETQMFIVPGLFLHTIYKYSSAHLNIE